MSTDKMFSTAPQPHRAILVGVCLDRQLIEETQAHMKELHELAHTRGIEVSAVFIQRKKHFDPKTKVGKGKVEEINLRIKKDQVDSVLFDDELTPAQVRNLEKALNVKVWDRTLLILEIFAMHARTVQAKTQVELAQYQYLLPRLKRMWTHLSRQGGGGKGAGMQGTGEKELETDKRIVQRKIHLLKEKLSVISRQAEVRRGQREHCAKVALVGYTNAGKSTLMQRLAKVDVLAEDKLFATLTTTVRKVVIQHIPFLLADTVGFIRKLPHTLVECFKSTLAEVSEADLLLHVVDGSHPQANHHIKVVMETLQEIGADKLPMILVLNKSDLLPEETTSQEKEKLYHHQYRCPVVAISAKELTGLANLQDLIYEKVSSIHQQRYPQNSAVNTAP
ncbi:MAG: GTPase HflX [Bacteroidota bacterium]